MYLATAQTSHYAFTALGSTRGQALDALRSGYAAHVALSAGMADPELMDELIADGDVNVSPIQPGECLRDGSRIGGLA